MLLTSQLDFKFPLELIATEAKPRGQSRIFFISREKNDFAEIAWPEMYDLFKPGDVLVLNDTKVLKARLVMGAKEVFFLKDLGGNKWEVLTKGLKGKVGKEFELPGGVRARFVEPGKPAVIELLDRVDFASYFEEHGHVPLPPYILAQRASHSDEPGDQTRYQTVWAEKMGSVAAPTASLHFDESHLQILKNKGVRLEFVTLHVGAGTFLPMEVERVEDFKIHSEYVSVAEKTMEALVAAKARGGRVWACGTTVLRALESAARFQKTDVQSTAFGGSGNFSFWTDLFVKPGFDFKVVDRLLTNFHQPQSSLLLLAAAFACPGCSDEQAVSKILRAYEKAIEKRFRLFSYGDLTVIG